MLNEHNLLTLNISQTIRGGVIHQLNKFIISKGCKRTTEIWELFAYQIALPVAVTKRPDVVPVIIISLNDSFPDTRRCCCLCFL